MTAKKFDSCQQDADCSGNMLCFHNATVMWVQQQYQRNICYCAPTQYFVGDNCDEVHESAPLFILYYVIEVISGFICVFASSWALIGLYRVRNRSKNDEISYKTPLVHTIVLCFLAGLCLIVNNIALLECNRVPYSNYFVSSSKTCQYYLVNAVFGALSSIFIFWVYLNVIVSWIALLVRVGKLKTKSNSNESKRLVVAVRCLETIYVCANIICLATGNFAILLYILLGFGVIFLVMYGVGSFYMSKLIKNATEFQNQHVVGTPNNHTSTNNKTTSGTTDSTTRQKQLNKAFHRVQVTGISVIILFSISLIFAIAGFVITNISGNLTSGGYNKNGWDRMGTLLADVNYTLSTFIVLSILWFVVESARAKILKLDQVESSESKHGGGGGGDKAISSNKSLLRSPKNAVVAVTLEKNGSDGGGGVGGENNTSGSNGGKSDGKIAISGGEDQQQ
jgi:hypothetical protein